MRLTLMTIRVKRIHVRQLFGALLLSFGLVAAVTIQIAAQSTPPATSAPVAGSSTPVSGTPVDSDHEIVWAREVDPATNAPARRASAFITTDPVIYAVLPVERIEQGAVVEATWWFDGTLVPALTTSITIDRTYEDGWIAYHLTRREETIWPTGEYAVSIAINGQQLAESTVEVTVPPS